MTTHQPDERITPLVSAILRQERIAYWRSEARENYRLGFMDLARRCEGFAISWEDWEAGTCEQ